MGTREPRCKENGVGSDSSASGGFFLLSILFCSIVLFCWACVSSAFPLGILIFGLGLRNGGEDPKVEWWFLQVCSCVRIIRFIRCLVFR